MNTKILPIIILLLSMFACKPSDKKLAETHLQKADTLFAQKRYNDAKLQIDSINTLYPEQLEARKAAKVISNRIQVIEINQTIVYTDSLLKIKQFELDSLSKNVVFEKNEKYETDGRYVYKQQKLSANSARTFIKAMVEENGQFVLMSSYAGTKSLKHMAFKLSVGDTFVETDPIPNDIYQNSFTSEGVFFETTIYKSDANKAIASFVQENMGKPILVTIIGKEGKTTYTLTNVEKKAISECYNYSVVLSDIKGLERIRKVAQGKLKIYTK